MEDIFLINKNPRTVQEIPIGAEWTVKETYPGIYSVFYNNSEKAVIIKTYKYKEFGFHEVNTLPVISEVKGVPRLLAHCIGFDFSWALLTKADGMDLYDYISHFRLFSSNNLKNIARQLFRILKEIHECGVIHCDVKPENIIYDPHTKEITLIDFGGNGTLEYSSPEQKRHSKLTSSTDIFSAGVTMYVLVVGSAPMFKNELLITKGPPGSRQSLLTCPVFIDFLEKVLEFDPALRYTAEDALNHPWLN